MNMPRAADMTKSTRPRRERMSSSARVKYRTNSARRGGIIGNTAQYLRAVEGPTFGHFWGYFWSCSTRRRKRGPGGGDHREHRPEPARCERRRGASLLVTFGFVFGNFCSCPIRDTTPPGPGVAHGAPGGLRGWYGQVKTLKGASAPTTDCKSGCTVREGRNRIRLIAPVTSDSNSQESSGWAREYCTKLLGTLGPMRPTL
eukprot:1192025-Prorocentrum_minimum.AAC.1